MFEGATALGSRFLAHVALHRVVTSPLPVCAHLYGCTGVPALPVLLCTGFTGTEVAYGFFHRIDLENFNRGHDAANPNKGEVLWRCKYAATQYRDEYDSDSSDDEGMGSLFDFLGGRPRYRPVLT
eukprot:1196357-Prorocentrum_minimum.AAC.5